MKTKSKVLVSALIAIVFCVSIIAGATFALFTSESQVNIAVTSGKIDVYATVSNVNKGYDSEHLASANEAFSATISEEEKTLTLDKMLPGDNVTFTIAVTNRSNVKANYRASVSVLEDEGLYDALEVTYSETPTLVSGNTFSTQWRPLNVGAEIKNVTVTISLPYDVSGEEYMDKSCTIVYSVEAVQGNANAVRYTLSDFNALSELPEEADIIYLDLGNASLKEDDLTIGNVAIADDYTLIYNSTAEIGEVIQQGKVAYTHANGRIVSSNKRGVTLVVNGTIEGDTDKTDVNQTAHRITLMIPDASSVIFEDTAITGFFQINCNHAEIPKNGNNPSLTIGGQAYKHKIASLSFDNCTFDGVWHQNGGFKTDTISFNECVFNNHINSVSANNSNPLWFTAVDSDVAISLDKCSFTSSRPIKFVETAYENVSLKITNCNFDMSAENDADENGEPKHVAIYFGANAKNGDVPYSLGNVLIENNTVKNATALMAFAKDTTTYTMAHGCEFRVSGNELNGALPGTVWKTDTPYLPSIVVQP